MDMPGFNPALFGKSFHEFVSAEMEMLGFLAPYLHVITLAILALVFIYGNRFRRLFVAYFTLQWSFFFGYWGIYGIIFWMQKGIGYLAMYIAAPVLLGFILWQWLKENVEPRIDLDFHGVTWWRWAVLLIAAWGFWYPSYVWGQGFVFRAEDLLFSNYGLMPCPTTMVVLSVFTLSYPRGNRTLFNLFTAYAFFIGIACVASGWFPDIPFVVLGIYGIGLITANRLKWKLAT